MFIFGGCKGYKLTWIGGILPHHIKLKKTKLIPGTDSVIFNLIGGFRKQAFILFVLSFCVCVCVFFFFLLIISQ